MKNPLLQRYWLTFDRPLELWFSEYGVTAYSLEDAIALLANALGLESTPTPSIARIVNSLDELDRGHVVPNMHPFVERGVWYPKLAPYT